MSQQIDLGQFIWPDVSQGRQPYQQIGIDWNQEISQGLTFYATSAGGALKDLVQLSQGTLSGTGFGPTAIAQGLALKLNGSNQYGSVPTNPAYSMIGAYTLMWAGVINSSSNYNFLIARAAGNGATNNPFELRTNSGGTILELTYSNASTNGYTVSTAFSPVLGQFCVIVVVANGNWGASNPVNIYVNGNLAGANGSSLTGGPTGNTSPLQFGTRGDLFAYAATSMTEAAGWNRALSSTEIAAISQNRLLPLGTPSLGLYVPSTGGGGATNYTLSGSAGSYAITGVNATLTLARKLSGAAGSYVISGQAATLTVGRKLAGAAGSYVVSGQSATMTVARKLSGSAGSYVINGQSATLTYHAGNTPIYYTLSGAAGAYSITGQPATLFYHSGAQIVTIKAGSWIRYRTF